MSMATTTASAARRDTRAVVRFAWVTLGFFILVVLWGAVVRATGSGDGCGSNWPLCNGDFIPHHPRLATVIEYTHRSTSGICAFLLAGLGFWTFAVTEPGHRGRKAVLWSAFLLVTEAILGAVLVLRHYVEKNYSLGRVVAQSIHFTNTMLFMASLALTAWFLSRDSERVEANQTPRWIALLAVVSTLVVGATGSLAALADTIFPSPSLQAGLLADLAAGSPLLVRMRWVHPAAALIGFVCVWVLARTGSKLSRLVLGLLLLQIVLGIADVLLLAPTWMQVVHLLGADLYWIALTLLAAKVIWPASRIVPPAAA
jgi:cytochrome c oxidase assembly protein subunit 15